MPPQTANLTSIDAVAALRAVLQQFAAEATSALTQLELEARRPAEWIEHDRALYWPREVRKASDRLSEARLALERCELTIDADNRRSCYDERKSLEKAKRRLRLAEDKVNAVRRWKPQIAKEIEDFQVQVEKLKRYLESDLVRAAAALGRMTAALDEYVQTPSPPSASASAQAKEASG